MGDSAGTQASSMTLSQNVAAQQLGEKRLRQLMFAQGTVGAGLSAASFMGSQRNADVATSNARTSAGSVFRAGQRRLGSKRARFGSSGVTLDGSPLDTLADQAMEAALDVELAKYAGRVEAAKHKQAGMQAIAGGLSSLAGGLAGLQGPPAGAGSIQLPAAQQSSSYATGAGTVLQPGVGQIGGLSNSYAPGAGTVLQPGVGVGKLW